MNTTEAPPGQVVDGALELERAVSLGVAQRNEILRLTELTAELGHRLLVAEKERDEAHGERDAALETAVRHESESQRLTDANRMLRERVARQHSTIESLRRQQALPSPVRVLVSAARRWSR